VKRASQKAITTAEWPSSFKEADAAMFTKHQIPAEGVVVAGIRRVNDGEARKEGIEHRGDNSGILYPYYDLFTAKQITCRVRRDHPEIGEDGKEKDKYLCPSKKKARRILYYPPGTKGKLEKHSDVLFVLVEAEKSALALESWGNRKDHDRILPIAMGGCWGWSQNREPLPDLDLFEGRQVFVLLDANAATNPKVRKAEDALVTALFARHCQVTVLRLPRIERVNGPDDLLTLEDGDERMTAVFASGQPGIVAPYSDDALATRFAAAQTDSLRYVRASDQWLAWDERRWKEDETQEAARRVQEFCKAEATECGKLFMAQRIRSKRTREAVQYEAGVKQQLAANIDQWDTDPWILTTPDGVVDLRTGNLRPARHDDYCTKLAGATPDATQPKRWLRFLSEITRGDKTLQKYLQKVCGYCLTGETSEQALFFLYGTGANGKSVFVKTLLGVLGDYALVAAMDVFTATNHLQHPTSVARLRGARLVTATETEDGSRWDEAKLKSITGGEPITAHFMRKDEFTFTPQLKLILTGNHQPRLRSVDEAIRRRIHLIPFGAYFPEALRDPRLSEKLREERGAILQWIISGCLQWQAEGLEKPRAVVEATGDYMDTQDVIRNWLEAETESDPNAKVQPTEFYHAFRRWADGRGEYIPPLVQFSQQLADRGVQSKKSNGLRWVVGRRLKERGSHRGASPGSLTGESKKLIKKKNVES
jgi:putative DNA primase/helicase